VDTATNSPERFGVFELDARAGEQRRRGWNNGAYVDFDRSLNKAIVKPRDALGDDADSPRYIETLPRHGLQHRRC
jgi:hypothetical protein